jgi:esterase/lipase superfamily enzyme
MVLLYCLHQLLRRITWSTNVSTNGSFTHHVDNGKVKIFSIDSINNESWMNNHMDPRHKVIRHQQWNDYVFNEVVPFIRHKTSSDTPIITCGASFGALHSMNLFLKRPI